MNGVDNAARVTREVLAAASRGDVALELIRLLAEDPNFRSAQASELVDESGGYRRPLRPEDFQWLDLVSSNAKNQSGLCALACNRVLACINERATSVRLPRSAAEEDWAAFRRFYGEKAALLGENLRPFLESLLFECWSAGPRAIGPWDGGMASLTELFERRLDDEAQQRSLVQGAGWARTGLTSLAWLQQLVRARGLMGAYVFALARGALLPGAGRLVGELEASLSRSAEHTGHGLSLAPYAHWQFYLPTTLGVVNHAHRAVVSGNDPLGLLGGLIASVTLQWAFLAAHEAPRTGEHITRVAAAAQDAIAEAEARYGKPAPRHIARGVDEALRVREANDHDLTLQVEWLRHFDEGRGFAASVSDRLRRGELNLPRETFVEPREMCSTTHVHDDHRLVVIETGRMVFWAMPHMRLVLDPGEALFVPKGRLHGSTIETAECVYHQPVLPDEIVLASNTYLQ